MPRGSAAQRASAAQCGQVLALCTHLVLLLLVLGQVVYLASRHRVRVDLTADKLSSTTDSTRAVLDGLDKRLLIEAYFSPKEKLPVNLRESRVVLDNFLDELVQLGKGKVTVQRFDPNEDKAIADRCTRIGVQPLDLQSQSSTSFSVDRHWQGLRLVYGGGKQKVLPQLQGVTHPFLAEATLTPAIKEVATEQKRKFGYMEWPAQAVGQQTPGGVGWNLLRTNETIGKRYEFQNYKDGDGALVPDDVDTLFLFRPKDLTDRDRYVFDQFLMRGGTLVVFADAVEYAIGPQRQFTQIPLLIDAPGSQRKFVEQLSSYGVDWRPKLVADMAVEAMTPRNALQAPFEYFAFPQRNAFGMQWQPIQYPYFFHAVDVDWSKAADALAKSADGRVDEALAGQYRGQFESGLPSDDFLWKPFRQVKRGPGLYWPTWVGVRTNGADLPADLDARVVMQSSPMALVEDPPKSVDPLGRGDTRTQITNLQRFVQRLSERLLSEPRQQAPLMVDVRGTFKSFFAEVERPKRPSEIAEEKAKAEAAAAKAAEAAPDPDAGPQPPTAAETGSTAPKEAEKRTAGAARGRIVMIGDSDFIRDDLLRGDYRQAGGPNSLLGGGFFVQLLDWLAEDPDLLELQSRAPLDRTLHFVGTGETIGADPRLTEQAVRRKALLLRAINIAVPAVVLGVFGLLLWLVRRTQKRSFLSSHAG